MEPNTNNLKVYLNHLSKTPQLPQTDEQRLLLVIEQRRAVAFKECFESLVFRKQIARLLRRKTRLRDDGTPCNWGLISEHTTTVEDYDLQKSRVCRQLQALEYSFVFEDLDLIGNFATALLELLDAKAKILKEVEALSKMVVFFNAKNIPTLFKLVDACLKDPDLRSDLEVHLHKTTPEILIKLREVLELRKKTSKFESLLNSPEELVQLETVTKILKLLSKDNDPRKAIVVDTNLRLVAARAKLFLGRGLDYESLVQEGNLGLIKAVEKYCCRHGNKLGTYATWWIDQTIQRAIQNKSKTIRIPTHIQTRQKAIRDATQALTVQGVKPTDKDIADYLGKSVSKITSLRRIAQHPVDLTKELDDGTIISLNTKTERGELNPFHITSVRLMGEKLRATLSKLNPLHEQVIRLKFGIGEIELTESEIARKLNVTKTTVSNRVQVGLNSLKKTTQ